MKNGFKTITLTFLGLAVLFGGLFVYEVKKEHRYTPKTAEILIDNEDIIKNAFIIKDGVMPSFNLAEHLSFISDVENGTAKLETTKKVFGFYECEINRVYDEYNPVITYRVSDESVAVINESGVVSAKSKGETVITVTADDFSIDIPITVYRGVQTAELEQNVVLLKGESKELLKLEEYDLFLSEFYSSDEKVAVVNQSGTVTAVSKGKAGIYTYNGDEKIYTQVTVKQPVESVSASNITLYKGESTALKVSYKPTNADYGTGFTYKVADTSIASVSGNSISAVNVGETVVTVISGNGISAQAKITVLNPPKATPKVKTISKSEYEAYSGEKYSDSSPYAAYFTITFDYPVLNFRINYVEDNFTSKKPGDAIYKNAKVAADSPLYFAICLNESDVLYTRGFYYTNKDGSQKYYALHVSGNDGSVLFTEY